MPKQLTAQQVILRIQTNLGVAWKTPSSDGFQSGSPDAQVTGIVTTFAPSLEVLRKAAAARKNMIVAREMPFYSRGRQLYGVNPATEQKLLNDDETCRIKRAFIDSHNLVIYRFAENWQARAVDGQLQGLVKALGWERHRQNAGYFHLPPTSLNQMAKGIQDRLKLKGLRVIGDPQSKVSKIALTHGFIRVPDLQQVLKEPEVDVVVTGEPVEWEAGPYFEDIIASGRKKGMIILGNEASEEPGASEMADWLKKFITEVSVEFIPAGEPFWTLS